MNAASNERSYLQPYVDAARTHGSGFESLLWASPATQAARFDAIRRITSLDGKSLLDVGCGRADLLEHLIRRGVHPHDYLGIEFVNELADAAEAKRIPGSTIVRADFVAEPLRLFVDADVVIFSGSLNTADDAAFYASLRHAFDAATESVVFNFLSSPRLAGQSYLYWRSPDDVLRFVKSFSNDIRVLNDYLEGDTTVCVRKLSKDA